MYNSLYNFIMFRKNWVNKDKRNNDLVDSEIDENSSGKEVDSVGR